VKFLLVPEIVPIIGTNYRLRKYTRNCIRINMGINI